MKDRSEHDKPQSEAESAHRRPASRQNLPAALGGGDISKAGAAEGRFAARPKHKRGAVHQACDWPEESGLSLLGEEGDQRLLCMPHGCRACVLGCPDRIERVWAVAPSEIDKFSAAELDDRQWAKRTVGYGFVGADIMLVGDWPRNMRQVTWNSEQYQGVFGAAQMQEDMQHMYYLKGTEAMSMILKKIIPFNLYHTTAMKCMVPSLSNYAPVHKNQCLMNYLGPEIEIVQPRAIISFGKIAKEMIGKYWFKSDSMAMGERHTIKTPSCWKNDHLHILSIDKQSDMTIYHANYHRDYAAVSDLVEVLRSEQ
jgi:uracil-DNA glycosylase